MVIQSNYFVYLSKNVQLKVRIWPVGILHICNLWISLRKIVIYLVDRILHLRASQNRLVDVQILCSPSETQEHKKTSHRPTNGFQMASKHFPGFHEEIL